jgi:AcrR family transcriptional regulator
MYCGCNEKAIRSQQAIACALLRQMEREPYDAISISALCREAGVSRPTFYSLFGSKDDVVSFLLRESYSYSPAWDCENLPELQAMCRGYSRYITDQRRFLTLLVDNAIGYLLYQSIFDALLGCDCFLAGRDASSRRYAANFAAGGLTGIVQDYVTREACSAEELGRLLETMFSGALFL